MKKDISGLFQSLKFSESVREFFRAISRTRSGIAGGNFSRSYKGANLEPGNNVTPSANPLLDYFRNHKEGPGIWKWNHYFDIYHRHFARFIGQKINILEIGIYSGGSLEMWQTYFGEKCHIYGVDIEEVCKAYENERVSVIIGDQGDRVFWRNFKKNVKDIDILIDDGGHTPEQQRITLEEMLPHLRTGGVYLCEDIHGRNNKFSSFAAGLVHELNSTNRTTGPLLQSSVSEFQSSIHSIHFYPYLVVIEKHHMPVTQLSAPRQGTEWQPFL